MIHSLRKEENIVQHMAKLPRCAKKDNHFVRCCKTNNSVNACGVNKDVCIHDKDEYVSHVDDDTSSSVHAKIFINGMMILF